ncbi:MAG: hypothetical protein ACRD5K_00415 [Candidatus Acidiferrales bacterium]
MAATQIVSQVVSFPQSAPAVEISQAELAELIEARNVAAQLEKRIEQIESDLRSRLEAGASVELGVHLASLQENFRRNVAWKDVVIRLAERLKMEGDAYCARVLAATKPTRSVSLVVIS